MPYYSVLAAATLCAAISPALAADEAGRASAPNQPPAPSSSTGNVPDSVMRRGATMEEIHSLNAAVSLTPDLTIYQLKIGNSRFFNGTVETPEMSDSERRAQIIAQSPFVSVIGCAL